MLAAIEHFRCGVGAAEATDYARTVGFTATIGTGSNGPNNRLATVTRGGTLTVGGTAYVTGITQSSATMIYDGNGNLTDDGAFTYTYDPLNRLVAVKAKSAGTPLVAQYFYDASGERAGVKAYNAGGVATTFMQTLRNGSEALYEKTWDLPGGTVNTEKVYLMAGGRMAVTRQTVLGTMTYTYYGTDHLGTVRSTVTLTSTGVAQPATFHDYEPFGVAIPGATLYTPPSTHRYTGQERDGLYDPATATTSHLDYMHFRSTSVSMGRFMRPDSIMGNMGNPQSWNLYSYVRGNPVNFNDPMGHMAQYSMPKSPRLINFYGACTGDGETDNPKDHAAMIDGAIQLANIQAALKAAGQDVTGSNVVYDAAAGKIYVVSAGKVIGTYAASHIVARTDKNGKVMHRLSLGDGKYAFLDRTAPHLHPDKPVADTVNGAYGPMGIFRLNWKGDDAYPAEKVQDWGIGIHSGMFDAGSYCAKTAGCFRTVDEGMAAIVSAAAYLPLNYFYVVNEAEPTHRIN
jgi:RHS repeat-associated protein